MWQQTNTANNPTSNDDEIFTLSSTFGCYVSTLFNDQTIHFQNGDASLVCLKGAGYRRTPQEYHRILQEHCRMPHDTARVLQTHKILNNEYPASLYLVAFRHTAHHYVMEVTVITSSHVNSTPYKWQQVQRNATPAALTEKLLILTLILGRCGISSYRTVTFNACTDPYR